MILTDTSAVFGIAFWGFNMGARCTSSLVFGGVKRKDNFYLFFVIISEERGVEPVNCPLTTAQTDTIIFAEVRHTTLNLRQNLQ